MPESEISELIAQIESEGNHYLHVPPVQGEWPKMTSGVTYRAEWLKKLEEQIRETQQARRKKDSAIVDEFIDGIVPAAWR